MSVQQSATAGRRLISSAEYKARRGGISEMTRWRNEQAGIGPKPIKVNSRNFYFEDEVQAYFDHLAATRQQMPDEQSAEAADDESQCLAKRTAGQ